MAMTQWEYALTLLPYDSNMTEEALIKMSRGALFCWINKTKKKRDEARKYENEELAREYEELCREHKNDLRSYAESMTKLERKSVHEYEGACPLCQDKNGFFVSERDYEHWWNCRACQRGGDVASLLMQKNNISFWEAVEELAGYSPRDKVAVTRQRTYTKATPKEKPPDKPPDFSREFKACRLRCAQNSLIGFAYFEDKRGLTRKTVLKNRVGMKQTYRGPAIIYPSERLVDGHWQITAYNRRFLDEVPAVHRKKKPKTMLVKGGSWGIYRLRRIRGARTLFVVEGEENALSVWQVARGQGWACDVVSVGCQDNFKSLRDDITTLASQYQHLLVWADQKAIADKAISMYRHKSSLAMHSPQPPGSSKALDANDLLKSGQLIEFVSYYCSHLSATWHVKQSPQRKLTDAVGLVFADSPSSHAKRDRVAITHKYDRCKPLVAREKQEQEIYELLNDAGWAMQGFHGALCAQGGRLYRQLEDTLDSCDIEAALKIHAQIKSLATQNAWDNLTYAQRQKYNALHL